MQYELTTPIQAHDEEVSVLNLKEPTTKLARKLGLPYRLDEKSIPYPLPDITARYISELAVIPPSSVDQLSIVDFNTLSFMVTSFFLSSAPAVEAKAKQEQTEVENPSRE